MKKFTQSQAIHGLDIPLNEDFNQLLPANFQQQLSGGLNTDSLSLLHYAQSKLDRIDTFAFKRSQQIFMLPPFIDDIMTFDVAEQLERIYSLLYPSVTLS